MRTEYIGYNFDKSIIPENLLKFFLRHCSNNSPTPWRKHLDNLITNVLIRENHNSQTPEWLEKLLIELVTVIKTYITIEENLNSDKDLHLSSREILIMLKNDNDIVINMIEKIRMEYAKFVLSDDDEYDDEGCISVQTTYDGYTIYTFH
jgi:septum formation topological specificity factor MinE